MKNGMIGYINRFRQFYARVFRPAGRKYGISQLEIDILLFLKNNPDFNTARDISSMRGFAKSNVSNAVEALKNMGYLEIKEDDGSRRLQRLVLSEDKERVVEELLMYQQKAFSLALSGFSNEETVALKTLFLKMDNNVRKYLSETE